MEDKKPTKAEQRKLDAANKEAFITDSFQSVLTALARKTLGVKGGPRISISLSNGNRYIRFNAHCRSAAILIYKNGNIDLKLEEFCHTPYSEQLFEFTLDKEEQKTFQKRFKKILRWLIPQIYEFEVYDFHSFMDFVCGGTSVEIAHQQLMEEWRCDYARRS